MTKIHSQNVNTAEAIKFIEKNKDHPFFIYLPHSMMHNPLHASDDFKGKSTNGIYGDAVEELDWSPGEILKKLRTPDLGFNHQPYTIRSNQPAAIVFQ